MQELYAPVQRGHYSQPFRCHDQLNDDIIIFLYLLSYCYKAVAHKCLSLFIFI